MVKWIAAGTVFALLLLGLLAYSKSGRQPLIVSGFIEADEIRLGSRIGGRVKEVRVEEGQEVSAGEVLVVLEEYDLEEKKAEAAANLQARQADLGRLREGFRKEEIAQAGFRVRRLEAKLELLKIGPRKEEIAAAKARLDLAAAQLKRAQQTYDRDIRLFEKATSAVTREQVDRDTEEWKVAESMEKIRSQELQLLEQGSRPEEIKEAEAEWNEAREALRLMENGYRPQEIAQAEASAAAADAAQRAIDAQMAELQIVSPVVGVVEAVELQKGDLVGAGAPVLSIMDTSKLWVRAYVPAEHLNFQLDDEVRVTVDSFPDRSFAGKITYSSRQAEFTPNNVQTPEDRSQQVFRIKVALLEGLDQLRPGVMADVWLEDGLGKAP